MVVVNDALKAIFNLRRRKDLEAVKHSDVLALDDAVAGDVESARRFRKVMDVLDKGIIMMTRMVRLFRV